MAQRVALELADESCRSGVLGTFKGNVDPIVPRWFNSSFSYVGAETDRRSLNASNLREFGFVDSRVSWVQTGGGRSLVNKYTSATLWYGRYSSAASAHMRFSQLG